ncbi:hypothetical protein [Flavobacterium branchiicola]|uniref:Signal peptidase n=1 Tax=Flavobacterium branchiicola TaxID=1114875 RepID=A0ABV9PMW3_9FLAO|nr:hypothetical protein [Flavobacterium branchiicola]MBS7256787.1 hypothetical protein [Flavobacterium branchiicola]
MKIIKAIFPVLFLTVISVSGVYAAPPTVPPVPFGAPPLPGGPIDENLMFLVVGGILLGAVYIYKDKIKKKLSQY